MMEKILEKLKPFKVKWRKYRNFRLMFGVIGVLTVFNLGANLFNTFIAFSVKAEQQVLREAQDRLITTNQEKIEELEMRQSRLDSRAAIQIVINATWHLIPQKDKDLILANWKNAEYGRAGETPPK